MFVSKFVWKGLRGFIVAIGGVITAIAGLVTILYTTGVISNSEPSGLLDDKGINHKYPSVGESVAIGKSEIGMVTLLPDIRDMGKVGGGGVSGSLTKGSNQPFSPPSFGDRGRDKEHRGFLTFSLNNIDRNVNIVSAKLYSAKGGQSGDLNSRYFKTVVVEELDLGSGLDRSDFSLPGVMLLKVGLNKLTREPIDVTQAVKRAHRRGKEMVSFRFRFSVGNDNDNEDDSWAFSYSRGTTRLEIELSQ